METVLTWVLRTIAAVLVVGICFNVAQAVWFALQRWGFLFEPDASPSDPDDFNAKPWLEIGVGTPRRLSRWPSSSGTGGS